MWQNQAACIDRDPHLFDGEDEYANAKAKEICFRCPARDFCLIDAMVNEEPAGVWGAHTPEERKEYRREFELKNSGTLHLLKQQYKRRKFNLVGKQERRLEKAREAIGRIDPALPRFEEYKRTLQMVISHPEEFAYELGDRLGKSESWVNHTLMEVWEMVS